MTQNYSNYYAILDIDNFKHFLTAKVTLEYLIKKENTTKLVFYIHKNLKIHDISSENLDTYEIGNDVEEWSPFISESKKITINLKKSIQKGETVNICFEYSGHITIIKDSEINRISDYYTELGIYSPWFPLSESLDEAYFNVKITTDNENIVVGNNSKQEQNHWIINQKIPSNDCTFLISKYFKDNKYEANFGNICISIYYIENKHKPISKFLQERISVILKNYTNTFGHIDSQNISIVTVPRIQGGGYCRPGLIILPDRNIANSHYKYQSENEEKYYFKYLAHELAHLWWSKANVSTWEDWLNESFAEFSCLSAIRDYYGEEEFIKTINKYRNNIKDLPPIKGLDRNHEKAFDVLYTKGPVLLYELEQEIGRDTFRKLLNSIHTSKADNTDMFLEKLLKHANKDIVNNFIKKLES